jgi:hypothetical protein
VHALGVWVVVKTTPHPNPLPKGERERELIFMLFKPEFDSEFQVDVTRKTPRSVPSTLRGEG